MKTFIFSYFSRWYGALTRKNARNTKYSICTLSNIAISHGGMARWQGKTPGGFGFSLNFCFFFFKKKEKRKIEVSQLEKIEIILSLHPTLDMRDFFQDLTVCELNLKKYTILISI